MRALIAALALLALAACATTPPDQASAVPESRQYAAPPSGPALLRITRDDGMFGAVCGVVLYFDGERIAKIGPGEQLEYRVVAGKHIVSADLSAGLCNAGMREVEVETAADRDTKLRISMGGNGDLSIAPTAF